VPIFAGFDLRRGAGRLFEYDVTGGRYEESNFAATGSGSLHATTVVKLGFREGLTREPIIDLALEALFHAADEDSATGGPDLVRRIFPVMATITPQGFSRVSDDEIEERFRGLLQVLEERERASSPRVPEMTTDVSPEGEQGGEPS
jgi:proteasome beta subunit